jgi:hypothetical protein
MSTIYELRPDVDYQWLTFCRESDFEVLQRFRGGSIRNEWTPLRVVPITEPQFRDLPAGDFPTLGASPVFSEHALEKLSDMLPAYGEVLPLKSEEGSYYVYNVLSVIDALDEGRSKLVRFTGGRVMTIEEYIFVPERVRGTAIFKIPQQLTKVFVSDEFVKRVRDAGLVGFKFVEL